jgi:aminoglycoside 6'-N-acetyltransferase I
MHQVREARAEDREHLAEMRTLLWPDGAPDEHLAEVDAMLSTGLYGTVAAVILVAEDKDDRLVGFLEVSLRSHADGCDPAHPVGYIEGWFVRHDCREKGIGRDLVRAAENWAQANGCHEMASDALADNLDSQRAHEALGFEVVDRCVHFRKAL